MTESIVSDGLTIMCIGVFFVMSFLCILIVAMHIMALVVGYLNKIFPEQVVALEKPSKTKSASDDEAIAVALAVIKARG